MHIRCGYPERFFFISFECKHATRWHVNVETVIMSKKTFRSFLSRHNSTTDALFSFLFLFECVSDLILCGKTGRTQRRTWVPTTSTTSTQRHSSRFLFIRKFNYIRNYMQWRDAGSQRRVERKQIPVDRINFESIYQLLLWIGQMIWHFLKLGIKAKSQSVKTWLCVRSIRMLINHFVYLCWAKNSRTHICTFTVYTHR